MAKFLFHGSEGFGDGKIGANIKLNWFNDKARAGRGRGFGFIDGTTSHKDMVRRVFGGELFGDLEADTLVGAADKNYCLRRSHRLDGSSCSSRRLLEVDLETWYFRKLISEDMHRMLR